MRTVAVTDPCDPRLAAFRGLTDVVARSAREPAEGLFIAEGAKVIDRAVATGHRLRAVLTEQRWLPGMAGTLAAYEGEVLVAPPELLREVTGYRVHRGALAAVERPRLRGVRELLAPVRTVAVLVDLVDHTNVGAVFRNAAALGVDAVLVTPACADPLYRRSVKVSMGAVLGLAWTRTGTDWAEELAAAGVETLALTPDARAMDIGALPAARGPRALLLGTEGSGLPDEVLAAADVRVRIPMAPGIDSLNVAAASAIAFHRLCQPRS